MSQPSIARASLPGSGAAKITFNSVVLWTRADLVVPLEQQLKEQVSSMYGRVTKTREGRKIQVEIPIYGFWDNLSTIFPSALMSPLVGSRLFGTSDLPMVILARNGDKLTVNNVRLTKLANLRLAANQQVFSGTATFTGLISNNTATTTANSYYNFQTAQAYAEGDFDTQEANFKSLTWTGAWGSRTDFTTILTQEGWSLDWEIKTSDDLVDGIGAVDMFVELVWGKASCIPVGPTVADLETNRDFQGSNAAVGANIAADTDDLTLTDGTSTFVLKAAAMVAGRYVFGPGKKRYGQHSWEGTLGFTTGAPNAIATVS